MKLQRSLILAGLGLWLTACAVIFPTPTPTPTPAVTPTARPLSLNLADIEAEFKALPPGDVAAGKQAFTTSGCVACHSLEKGVRIVGPSMADVGVRAATEEDGYSAELYLYKSLTRPDSHILEGYTAGLMPKTFIDVLTPQTQADLIAFLLTLK